MRRVTICVAALAALACPLTASAQTFEVLGSLSGTSLNLRAFPAPLVEASDGGFYGSTVFGGTYQMGTIYRMDHPFGTMRVVHEFVGGPYGNGPVVGLLQASDGNF